MSQTIICDLCGTRIESAGIELEARGAGRVPRVNDYHPDCFHEIRDAIDMFAASQRSIDSLPVHEPPLPLVRVVGISASRALLEAGIPRVELLAERSEREVAAIKGVGPSTMQHLRAEMAKRGLRFRDAGVAA